MKESNAVIVHTEMSCWEIKWDTQRHLKKHCDLEFICNSSRYIRYPGH